MASFRFSDPELAENIDLLERYLLQYESALTRGEEDTSQVQFIFRYAHNLKSSLGMLGFTAASSLLHKVESCFDLVRNAHKRATADLSRTALQVVDIVRSNLQAPEGSELLYQPNARYQRRHCGGRILFLLFFPWSAMRWRHAWPGRAAIGKAPCNRGAVRSKPRMS